MDEFYYDNVEFIMTTTRRYEVSHSSVDFWIFTGSVSIPMTEAGRPSEAMMGKVVRPAPERMRLPLNSYRGDRFRLAKNLLKIT